MGFRLPYLHLTFAYAKVQGYLLHISTVNISKIVTDWAHAAIAFQLEIMYGFVDGDIYIWPWSILNLKVKLLHISTLIIF